jgi:hypothetical protein
MSFMDDLESALGTVSALEETVRASAFNRAEVENLLGNLSRARQALDEFQRTAQAISSRHARYPVRLSPQCTLRSSVRDSGWWTVLPNELVVEVFAWAAVSDLSLFLKSLPLVCFRFHELSLDPLLWRKIFERWVGTSVIPFHPALIPWKERVRELSVFFNGSDLHPTWRPVHHGTARIFMFAELEIRSFF